MSKSTAGQKRRVGQTAGVNLQSPPERCVNRLTHILLFPSLDAFWVKSLLPS